MLELDYDKFRIFMKDSKETIYPYDITFIPVTGRPATFSYIFDDFGIGMFKWDEENNVLQRLVAVYKNPDPEVNVNIELYEGDILEMYSGFHRVFRHYVFDGFGDKISFEDLDPMLFTIYSTAKVLMINDNYTLEEIKSSFHILEGMGFRFSFKGSDEIHEL